MLPGPGHAPRTRRGRRTAGTPATSPPAGDVTIGKVFDEADRRDPDHLRTWIALVDGDNSPARPVPGRRRRPRHHPGHRDRLHPRAGIPVEGRLVLPPAPRPGHGRLGDRPGAGHPARPHRRRHRPDRPGSPQAPPEAGQRARQDHPQDPVLPAEQAALDGLPARPWRPAGRSPPASSRAPAATSSRTGWFSAVAVTWTCVP